MTALTAVKTDPAPASDPAALTPAAVREDAELSRPEMARLLGMSEFGYTQWEAGNRRAGGPAYRLLHLIARDGKPVIDALREAQD